MLKNKIKSAVKVFSERIPAITVLDVGCREGYSTQYLKKAGYAYAGIEIEQKWVDHNHKKGRTNVVCGDFLTYKFQLPEYDAIFSRHCIEHTGSVEKFLKKCYDVLTPKGFVFIIMPLEQTVLLDMGKDDEKDTISELRAMEYIENMALKTKFKEIDFNYTKEFGIIPMDNDYLFIGRKV